MPSIFSTIPFVSTAWLGENMQRPEVKIVDCTWHLPPTGRSGPKEFAEAHIPGATFFDLDVISDQASPYAHMLPSAEYFAQKISTMGISNDDTIIVYDQHGLFTAARGAWMFRLYGARDVRLLEGGLPLWVAEKRPVTAEPSRPAPARFEAKLDAGSVADIARVSAALKDGSAQIVDARPAPRFLGEAPEPRPGVRAGHMPGSLNLPFPDVVKDGALKSPEELRAELEKAGIDLSKPAITSCGSGVSAVVIAMALEKAGTPVSAIYDGSWAEWGAREDLPVAKG